MKCRTLWVFLLWTTCLWSQITFTDPNLKTALIAAGYDSNIDGEIDLAEAAAVTDSIHLSSLGLTSLDGMEHFINATGLVATDNNLTAVPDLTGLTALQTLNLSFNSLGSLAGWNAPANLTQLAIFACDLTALPDNLTALTQLNTLAIEFNQLTALPDLSPLVNLDYFDCRGNQLTSIPGLAALTGLRHFNCRTNLLSDLSMLPMGNLDYLNVYGNQLTSLPNLSAAPNLRFLYCRENQLSALTGLDALANLIILEANDNQITSLPNLDALVNLEVLNVNQNQISTLPSLNTMTSLRWLQVSHNNISALPSLTNNTALTKFHCQGNNLTALPDLSTNAAMEDLSCGSNQITVLPGLGHMSNLSLLDCTGNLLTTLPSLTGNPLLWILSFGDNQISVNPDLSAQTNLFFLLCFQNQITDLGDLSHMTQLQVFLAHENLLTDLPIVSGNLSLTDYSVFGNDLGPDDCPDIATVEARGLNTFAYNPQWDGSNVNCDVFVIAEVAPTTTETGGTSLFSVGLGQAPTDTVTINISSAIPAEGDVFPQSLIFTTTNWNQPRTVTVTGVDDVVIDGDMPYTIILDPAISTDPFYNGVDPDDVAVVNLDDDDPAVVTVSAEDVQVYPGGIIEVTVDFSNTDGTGLTGFQFQLDFDPGLLDYTGNFNITGGLADGWTVAVNDLTGGILIVGGFGVTPMSGAGTVVTLEFTMDGSATEGQCSQLGFSNVFLNAGTPAASTDNGSICAFDCTKGDLDRDGAITNADASLAFNKSMGFPGFEDIPDFCADADCDDILLPFDASLISQRAAGTITDFCGGLFKTAVAGSFGLRLPPLTFDEGEPFWLPVLIDPVSAGDGIVSFLFALEYDPAVLEITGFDQNLLPGSDWELAINPEEPGRVLVGGFAPTPMDGESTLIVLAGSAISSGQTAVTWDRTVLNNGAPLALPEPGSLTVSPATPDVLVLDAEKDSILRPGNKHRNEGLNPLLHLGENRRLIAGFGLDGINLSAVTSARLVLTIQDDKPPSQWGNGRYVDAWAIQDYWLEGNGKAYGLPGADKTRGSGPGVTWVCAVDSEIANQKADCNSQWSGGNLPASPSDSVLHTNGMSGAISFDVTSDVRAGINSWLMDRAGSGNVRYYSKDNQQNEAGPRLVLEF